MGLPKENGTTFSDLTAPTNRNSSCHFLSFPNSLIRAKNRFVKNGTANFDRNIPTEISGPPPEVTPNIPVGRNRNGPFHFNSDRNFRNLWHNIKTPGTLWDTLGHFVTLCDVYCEEQWISLCNSIGHVWQFYFHSLLYTSEHFGRQKTETTTTREMAWSSICTQPLANNETKNEPVLDSFFFCRRNLRRFQSP